MTAPFDAIDVIRAKRDGLGLSAEQIRWVIGAYTDRVVPDEQMSALLMAVFFRGMSGDELAVVLVEPVAEGRELGPTRADP